MTFRMSPEEARLRAQQLAEILLSTPELITADGAKWTWNCGGAVPDPDNPRLEGRKVPRRWVVGVRWYRNGTIQDGPGTIIVDVELGTADFEE